MEHFAGLDVTSVCIVDDTGKIIRQVKVTSEGSNSREAMALRAKSPRGVRGNYCCM